MAYHPYVVGATGEGLANIQGNTSTYVRTLCFFTRSRLHAVPMILCISSEESEWPTFVKVRRVHPCGLQQTSMLVGRGTSLVQGWAWCSRRWGYLACLCNGIRWLHGILCIWGKCKIWCGLHHEVVFSKSSSFLMVYYVNNSRRQMIKTGIGLEMVIT